MKNVILNLKKNIYSLPKKFKPKKVKPLQVYLCPWKPYQVPVSIDCYTISLPVIIMETTKIV